MGWKSGLVALIVAPVFVVQAADQAKRAGTGEAGSACGPGETRSCRSGKAGGAAEGRGAQGAGDRCRRPDVPRPQQERQAGSLRGLAAAGGPAGGRPGREDDGGGEGRADDSLVAGRVHRAERRGARPAGRGAAWRRPRRRERGPSQSRVRRRRKPEQRRTDGQREPRAARQRAPHPVHPGPSERGRVARHHREVPQRASGDGGGEPPRHPDRVQHRPAARCEPSGARRLGRGCQADDLAVARRARARCRA